jgi:hypothetical protein
LRIARFLSELQPLLGILPVTSIADATGSSSREDYDMMVIPPEAAALLLSILHSWFSFLHGTAPCYKLLAFRHQ